MDIETVMDDGKVQRYLQASEWLVCFKCASPSESEVERWLVWCEEDARNLAAFEELYRDWNDIEGLLTAPELIPATDRPFLESMRDIRKQSGFAFSRFMPWRPAVVAAMLIIFVSGYAFWGRMTEAPRLVTSTNWKPAVLPDGSSLTLSAKAAAEVDFTGPDRDLKLRPEGEAYIKVRHDKARRFIVRAGTVTVTAIGTAFDVRREGDHAIVSVEEGTVRMAAPGAAGQLQWQASAGYRIDYSEREKTAVVSSIDVQRALQWRSGELSYDRTPLATVIGDINRYSTTRIVISDPELERMEFSGTVFVASIGDWLTAFETIYPVRASDSSVGVIQIFATHDRDRRIPWTMNRAK
jgi:transmembrane sensor